MLNLYKLILEHKEKISIIGLGYVGLPLAISFAKKIDVIGFDTNTDKIDLYKSGVDITSEVGNDAIVHSKALFTSKEEDLRKARFHIIAVPTPIKQDKTPDLKYIKDASALVGRNLLKDSIVVYESTVYPGLTEEICVPILEEESGLKCGVDFKVGYSPERINPGDKEHNIENIVKVVSGMDEESLEIISRIYELIVKVGVYRAQSIKVAEAAKAIENAQRDINIAFVNELSIIFNKMGIDTKEVLRVAGTKWNFLAFSPGLVGGHCIGVDPYYLTYKAEQLGYHSQIILAGRRINDYMGKYVAENTVKYLIKADKQIKGAKVAIMGITFKEDCPDVRNSKVLDIINELNEYGIDVKVVDPVAKTDEVWKEYKIKMNKLNELESMDAVIFAVAHKEFTYLTLEEIKKVFCNINPILIDVKAIFNRKAAKEMGYLYWRL